MLDDPPRVVRRPGRVRAARRELLVEPDEQPHELAADGPRAEDLRQLGVLDQPVRVPRRPVGVIAVDDAEHEVVRLAGLLQQRGDPAGAVIHRRQSCISRSSKRPALPLARTAARRSAR